MYTLFAAKGWGSVIAEVGFVYAGVPYRREEVDPEGGPDFDRLKALNPLAQFPTVIMPDTPRNQRAYPQHRLTVDQQLHTIGIWF